LHQRVSGELGKLEIPSLPRLAASRVNAALGYKQAESVVRFHGNLAKVNGLIDKADRALVRTTRKEKSK